LVGVWISLCSADVGFEERTKKFQAGVYIRMFQVRFFWNKERPCWNTHSKDGVLEVLAGELQFASNQSHHGWFSERTAGFAPSDTCSRRQVPFDFFSTDCYSFLNSQRREVGVTDL
jgi:hypothetical protein